MGMVVDCLLRGHRPSSRMPVAQAVICCSGAVGTISDPTREGQLASDFLPSPFEDGHPCRMFRVAAVKRVACA